MVVKYIRISTIKQTYLLDKIDIKFNKSYEDKIIGKVKVRTELKKMIEELHQGDTVYCESISNLGRTVKELTEIIESLTNKGIRVIILKEGIDTTNSSYKVLLDVLKSIDEMEKENIQEKIQDSINQLKELKENKKEIKTKSGKWFGREEKTIYDLPRDFTKYYNKMINKEITKVEMAKLLGVGRATLYRWLKLYEN